LQHHCREEEEGEGEGEGAGNWQLILIKQKEAEAGRRSEERVAARGRLEQKPGNEIESS
jgi:hypothetical protein